MNQAQNDPTQYALVQIFNAELANQGASESDLARWTGLKQPSVWRKLNGQSDLKASEIFKIIYALGLPLADTMQRAEDEAKRAGDPA